MNELDKIYFTIKEYTKVVIKNKNIKGFLLWGEGGLGKSYNVKKAFEEEKKTFVTISGHVTPLALYTFLYENRNKFIILDDVAIFGSELNLNLLKSALGEDSMVSYNTSRDIKIPSRFKFKGKIIMIMNKIPENEDMSAVESRVLVHELKMDYETKIKVLNAISLLDYEGIDLPARLKIAKWIENNATAATQNLNLRLLFLLFEFYKYDVNKWEKLAKELIKTDRELELIVAGMKVAEWCKATGMHRATYFRHKQKLGKFQKSQKSHVF